MLDKLPSVLDEESIIKNIIQLDNIGKEGHTYLYHIINNYKKLSKINFFISASFINFKDRLINFTRIYKKLSDLNKKKYKGLYTFDGYFFLKNKKLKILDPNFRIFQLTFFCRINL